MSGGYEGPVLAIVGPTATGKSDFALRVADRLGGPDAVEIVGADALQLYRGMDIGTAKLGTQERRGYVHHQIDVLNVQDEASVATYQVRARQDIETIRTKGRIPLVVGGSGLYLRALLDRIEFPGTDPGMRTALENDLERLGAEKLHQRLAQVDSEAALRIDPLNGRRIVRALEVIALTGRPFSASLPSGEYHQPTVQFGLRLPLDVLEERIRLRTELMFEQGLIEEVEVLAKQGFAKTRTASKATGYSQALALAAGQITLQQAKEDISLATFQLAKKQMKWFKRDSRIIWLDPMQTELELENVLGVVTGALAADDF